MRENTVFNKSYIGLRRDLLKYIQENGCRVLDVGCGIGINGKYLKENGIASYVVGIEIDDSMAEVARDTVDEIIVADLNRKAIEELGLNVNFDYILLGDILEHLLDPWSILKDLSNKLNKKGTIIISLPNIQHIETFLQIYVNGAWPFNNRGIFDRTHVRFFTYSNIIDLIDDAGLHVIKCEKKFRYRDAIGSNFPFKSEKILTRFFPKLFTFQYIFVCRKFNHAEKTSQ
jgi:2-polyprenyl-3-methyl-5-hydroxy-6-metoxy-1,4-benzoquinol methylase